MIHEWQNKVGAANLLDIFPALRFLPSWKPMQELKAVKADIYAVYADFVNEHKQNFDQNSINDVIDVYLQEYGLECDNDILIGLFFSVVGWSICLYISSDLNAQRILEE